MNLYWEGHQLHRLLEETHLIEYRPQNFDHPLRTRHLWWFGREDREWLMFLAQNLIILQEPAQLGLLWLVDMKLAEELEYWVIQLLKKLPILVLDPSEEGWVAWLRSEDKPKKRRAMAWTETGYGEALWHCRMYPAKGFVFGIGNLTAWSRLPQVEPGPNGYRGKGHWLSFSEGSSGSRRKRRNNNRIDRRLCNHKRRAHDKRMLKESREI